MDGSEQNSKYRVVFSSGVDVDAICTRDGLKRFIALSNANNGEKVGDYRTKGGLVLELSQDFSLKEYVGFHS